MVCVCGQYINMCNINTINNEDNMNMNNSNNEEMTRY